MKHLTIIFLLTCLVSAFILAGCSASDESEKDQTTSSQTVPEKKADRTPPPAPAPKDSTKAEATTEVTQAPPKQT